VTRDHLLADDWPRQWSPLSVVVRPVGDTIELIVEGQLDAWTVGALLRNLASVYEPSFRNIHVDLSDATGCDPSTEAGLARCRDFASSHNARFRVTSPAMALPSTTTLPVGSVLPGASGSS
jgi:hypothetical protein